MNIKSTIKLYAEGASPGGQTSNIHAPHDPMDTPKLRDFIRKRQAPMNPDVDAAELEYKEKSQSDNAAFVGKKYRTQDTKYGHLINEYDDEGEAHKASLARPYTRVLSQPEPKHTEKSRAMARRRAAKVNPDVQ